MDEVFKALADTSRRRLLDSLNARNGQTLRELCAELEMARQSVSKHLAVLEAADLVTTVRRGREKLHYLNAVPIHAITERWIGKYEQQRVHALSDLKRALEDSPMTTKPQFVYTTYIKTTPEQLWKGLTEPAFTERYWGVALESDWKAGSPVVWHMKGTTVVADPEQVVLEADPFRRLAYTWHTLSPEWARAYDIADEQRLAFGDEERSTVAFDIEDLGEMVKLTVVHEGGAKLVGAVGDGWPPLISSLKTLLETGDVLPTAS